MKHYIDVDMRITSKCPICGAKSKIRSIVEIPYSYANMDRNVPENQTKLIEYLNMEYAMLHHGYPMEIIDVD